MTATTVLTEAAEKVKPLLSALPPSDRLALAHYLYDSLDEEEILSDEEFHAEWAAELNRRVKESEMGLDVEVPSEEVHRSAREMLGRMTVDD